MLYLSSHFGLGYAPWEVQRAAWAASGASWMEKEWMCAGGCVGADACVGAGETPLSAAAPGQVRQRPGPNSEPKTGCSALAWAVRDLEEREREKKKTQRPVGLWVPQRWRRKSQYSPGIPCFCRSCCGGFLREDSLVEVREMPVTKYQSESPNEAGNTWLVGWMISTGWYLKTRENTMSHHSRKHHLGAQQAAARVPPRCPPRGCSDPTSALPLRSPGTHRPASCQLSPSRGVQPHCVDGSPMHDLHFDMRGVKGQTAERGSRQCGADGLGRLPTAGSDGRFPAGQPPPAHGDQEHPPRYLRPSLQIVFFTETLNAKEQTPSVSNRLYAAMFCPRLQVFLPLENREELAGRGGRLSWCRSSWKLPWLLEHCALPRARGPSSARTTSHQPWMYRRAAEAPALRIDVTEENKNKCPLAQKCLLVSIKSICDLA